MEVNKLGAENTEYVLATGTHGCERFSFDTVRTGGAATYCDTIDRVCHHLAVFAAGVTGICGAVYLLARRSAAFLPCGRAVPRV